eukprot:gene7353-11675_t
MYRLTKQSVKIGKLYTTQNSNPKKFWNLKKSLLTFGVLGFSAGVFFVVKKKKFHSGVNENETNDNSKPKLVILGTGWGALSCLQDLDTSNYQVTLISPRNYFLFTPLLPGVVTGNLEAHSIMEPIRKFCHRTSSENVSFFEAKAVDVDVESNTIHCKKKNEKTGENIEFKVDYDYLVVAVGAVNNTFGIKGVNENCHFLKSIPNAIGIKKQIIDSYERASLIGTTEEEKKRLLRFIVIGGGPAGTEFAGELKDFIDQDLKRWYPNLSKYSSICIVDLLDHILNTFSKDISEYVENQYKKREIEIKTGTKVVAVEKDVVKVINKENQTENLPYGVAIWTTGIGTSPLVHKIRSKIEEQTNRVALITDDFCKVKGSKNIYSIGDCASVAQDRMLNKIEEIFSQADINNTGALSFNEFKETMTKESKRYKQLETFGDKLDDLFHRNDSNKDGVLQKEEFQNLLKEVDAKLTSLPPTAQRASQQGVYLAEYFNKLANNEDLEPFKFKFMGKMSYIGDSKAVFENTFSFKGLGAMYLWKSFYLSKQYSWTNKFSIFGNWTQTYLFGRKITRE